MIRKVLYISEIGSMYGGAEISLKLMLKDLDRERYVPWLLVPEAGELSELAAEMDIPVLYFKFPQLKHPLGLFRLISASGKFSATLRKNKIDIVHANTNATVAPYCAVGARRAGIPSVWHVRLLPPQPVPDFFQVKIFTKIITNSHAVATRFTRFAGSGGKIVTVHNVVDLEAYKPLSQNEGVRNKYGAEEGEILICAIGRLVEHKGVGFLIDAADIAACSGKNNFRYIIVGDGAMTESFKRHAASTSAAKKFVFTGRVSESEIPAIINACDILVLPSIEESFGRVVIEAMASARPVIATRVGGVPEIIEDGISGIIVPPGDPQVIADATVKLGSDSELRERIGRAGRERVERHFSSKGHAAAVMDVYDSCFEKE